MDDLKTDRTLINIKDDYLQSLTSREVMTDDYDSNDTLIPHKSAIYNGRLNIAGIRKKLFGGYHPNSIFAFTNGYIDPHAVDDNNEHTPLLGNQIYQFRVYVYIKKDGRDIVVNPGLSLIGSACFDIGLLGVNPHLPFLYFFYPDVDAYKAVIIPLLSGVDYMEKAVVLKLDRHEMLNGAFYFNGWDNPPQEYHGYDYSSDADTTIPIANKVYTSEVNNPFVFPVTGINTIGVGNVFSVATAAKALSQGQFGQFPLYAFTSEGVWALEVSYRLILCPPAYHPRCVCQPWQHYTNRQRGVVCH